MLGQGRGGYTVVQILTLIQKSHVKKTKQSTCILNSVRTVHVSSETFALVIKHQTNASANLGANV